MTYSERELSPVSQVLAKVCDTCGSVVADEQVHDEFHANVGGRGV